MTGYLQSALPTDRKTATITSVTQQKIKGEKLVMLTCYDASFAALMDRCAVEILLIGDSLGMVCQGHSTTLGVSVDDIAYHTACVARGNRFSLLVADMPFGAFASLEKTYEHACQLMKAGAHMIKIEGGAWVAPTVEFLTQRAVPVCAHLGLTPQSVHQLGGFKVQGKTSEGAATLLSDALLLQKAGASMLVLEAIPSQLGKEVTEALTIPTIGIGAGPDCSGQVLVLHDILDVFPGRKPRFVKNFMQGQVSIEAAITAYVREVKSGVFPAPEHCF